MPLLLEVVELDLIRFRDGRLELDTNPVENQIRPLALTRKNALFAGNDIGDGELDVARLARGNMQNERREPRRLYADTLRALLDGHPKNRIQELMPWAFRKTSSTAA